MWKRAATYILGVGSEKHVSLYSMEWRAGGSLPSHVRDEQDG